ncbi:hypothetical protein PTSG_08009 [Salpingoeca rosetta]|uniref:UDP-N-acetylglucosamine--dolichyl-phosphate N-acetylglucosaminephosphotransferase n=1 Tax=Salpingoeca rosetta (strain ATCC 50818 / BSB-021) TaxID=946362 RepID=F2UHR0_SALR5|nr:uncharacterized protein PTSG_08009 [Salpingoeca rosetta]EGD76659.1 hypothetical protein PTSG_08009 [Salpingoeca rosetta]|eukprot:XP_004991031.1 hypothetical protein PTSG_08009 [Salpingoeca rosetta]
MLADVSGGGGGGGSGSSTTSVVGLALLPVFAAGAWLGTVRLIPAMAPLLERAGIAGVDLNKPGSTKKIPEAVGVVCGLVYLVTLFLYIPFHFDSFLLNSDKRDDFPHEKFVEFVCALLSICCMIFLGFADDVLNLAWRHKLWLPTVASLPLLMVYYVNVGSTWVLVPPFMREWVGGETINLGYLFYVYMSMLAVFCTNAINIMAGINGVEAGQSLIIAASLVILNIVLSFMGQSDHHLISLCLLLPFCGVTAGLLRFNWFPSSVFVGDTFCYFAGMTFAVAAILGHFSRTLLLFLAPQTFNFVLSVPQLFKIVPCPRHRMPRVNARTGLLEPSVVEVPLKSTSSLGLWCIAVARMVGLVRVVESTDERLVVTNFTVINTVLTIAGPMHERNLVMCILFIQVVCSVVALALRFGVLFV